MDFKHYRDPEKSERVWRTYIVSGTSDNIMVQARELYHTCKTSDELDIALDRLVEGHSLPQISFGNPVNVDCDRRHRSRLGSYQSQKNPGN